MANEEYNEKWMDICSEFDCTPDYCKECKGRECNGEFWKEDCVFNGEHKILNLNEDYKDIPISQEEMDKLLLPEEDL